MSTQWGGKSIVKCTELWCSRVENHLYHYSLVNGICTATAIVLWVQQTTTANVIWYGITMNSHFNFPSNTLPRLHLKQQNKCATMRKMLRGSRQPHPKCPLNPVTPGPRLSDPVIEVRERPETVLKKVLRQIRRSSTRWSVQPVRRNLAGAHYYL
jgi:hypothetical protein